MYAIAKQSIVTLTKVPILSSSALKQHVAEPTRLAVRSYSQLQIEKKMSLE